VFDISELYQVETKALNQAVKRNISRFPEDFMFQLTEEAAQQYKELNKKLAEIEQTTQKHFKDIYQALNYLLDKRQKEEDFGKRERIGFKNS
jgi:hypothetical protein